MWNDKLLHGGTVGPKLEQWHEVGGLENNMTITTCCTNDACSSRGYRVTASLLMQNERPVSHHVSPSEKETENNNIKIHAEAAPVVSLKTVI